jgi:hypothetical protein
VHSRNTLVKKFKNQSGQPNGDVRHEKFFSSGPQWNHHSSNHSENFSRIQGHLDPPTPLSEESSFNNSLNFDDFGSTKNIMHGSHLHALNQPIQASHELQSWLEPSSIGYPVSRNNSYYGHESKPLTTPMGVKFVNSTPDSLEDQIKREELEPKKKRLRTNADQLRTLNKEFLVNQTPNATARAILAKTLGMSTRAVQVWFQNRRAKAKVDCKKVDVRRPSYKEAGAEITEGVGHRRAYSHNSVYHYPSKLNQTFYSREGGADPTEELSESDEGLYEGNNPKPGLPLGEFMGTSGSLFMDPNDMVLLNPISEPRQKKRSVQYQQNSFSAFQPGFGKQSSHQEYRTGSFFTPSLNTHSNENEDLSDSQLRFSPYGTGELGEDFYGGNVPLTGNADLNRTNSLPLGIRFNPNLLDDPGNCSSLIPDEMANFSLQEPLIPNSSAVMYNYCNAFSPLTTDDVGQTSSNPAQSFYYHPPPPQILAPFSRSTLSNGMSEEQPSSQKRSFSMPCVRPDLQPQQLESNRISNGEDEELLLGLGAHIISNEAEGRVNRINSISISPAP